MSNMTASEVIALGLSDEMLCRSRAMAREIAELVAGAVEAERERCAKIAIDRAEHHRDHCEPDCKCANGWHIALAIRTP